MSSERAGEVVCELANMLCGSVLSRMDATAVFELSCPELAGNWPGCRVRGLPLPASRRPPGRSDSAGLLN